jgi:hypothetical protein
MLFCVSRQHLPKVNSSNADRPCTTTSMPVNGPNRSTGSQISNKMSVSARGTGVPPVNQRERQDQPRHTGVPPVNHQTADTQVNPVTGGFNIRDPASRTRFDRLPVYLSASRRPVPTRSEQA